MLSFLKLIGYSILVLIFGGSLYLAIDDPQFPVIIQESEAQTLVDSKMPFEKKIDIKVPLLKNREGNLIVKSAQLDFLENGNIQIETLLSVYIDGRYIDGFLNTDGKLVYIDGQFFIQNLNINDYKLNDYEITEKDKLFITKGKDLLEKGQNKLLKIKGLFKRAEDEGQLYANTTNNVLSKITDMNASVKDVIIAKSQEFIVNKLETTPIYELKSDDYKQNIAKLMLEDIVVENDMLTVNMSGGKLISSIWLYIISFISALAFIIFIFKSSKKSSGGSGNILSNIADISLDIVDF